MRGRFGSSGETRRTGAKRFGMRATGMLALTLLASGGPAALTAGAAEADLLRAAPSPAETAAETPPGALPGPDFAASTPQARPGTAAASRRALSRSELRRELERAMRSAGGASGAWAYDIDAKGKALLFRDDASARRVPASNQKLFTTATFLSELGAEGRLETRAYARGRTAGPRESVLEGDLVLVGDGDPTLGTARFGRANNQPVTRVSKIAGEIAAAGIEQIKGRILADDTIFDRERRAGPYLSPLSGLSFNNGYDGGGYSRAPELVAAKALKSALAKREVKVRGRVGHANLTDSELGDEPLASVNSPTAARLIEETNVPSNNFFAEMLLKRVGASDGARGTRKRGTRKVEAFARRIGTRVRASDGSGLSRKNKVTPEQLGMLLVKMAGDHEEGEAFRDSLPVAGREGTLADRMRGTAAEGRCAAKTGTLTGVSALSGYCDVGGGHTVAFSVLNNSVNVDAARSAQDRFAAAIARFKP